MDDIKDRFGDGAIFRAKLLKDEDLNTRKLGKTDNNAPTLKGIRKRKKKGPEIKN